MKIKTKTFFFPVYVSSNSKGYQSLIELYSKLKHLENTEILIDFSKCIYFEANLSAVLGSIFRKISKQNISVKIGKLKPSISNVLHRNGFLCKFGAEKIEDSFKSTISYQEFEENKGVNFKDYIRDHLLRKNQFPTLSILAEKKINESIFEIFENAHTHGNCDRIHTCGQFFSESKPPKIDMTIVDLGQSIKENVNRNRQILSKTLFTGIEAIEWAIIRGNTTKTGNNPGGLGLDIIREFVDLNNGKLQIVSADGFWEYKNKETSSNSYSKIFPGTIVNIEFNLDDKNYYKLKSEISLDGIF